MFTRNLKVIEKDLDSSVFWTVGYSVRSESGCMIALWDQEYYVPGLPKCFYIIYPQGISTSEGYRVTFIAHCCVDCDSHAELNLKEDKQDCQNTKLAERVNTKYDPKNNLPTHVSILPIQIEKDDKVTILM